MNPCESAAPSKAESCQITLTCKGLSSVNWNCSDDFEFVLGNSRLFRVHSVLAEFLSPKVARLRRCDPFYNVYAFEKHSSELFRLLEGLVSTLRSGESLQVTHSNLPGLLQLSQELENTELFSSLSGMIDIDSLTLEEAVHFLRTGIDLGTAFSEQFGKPLRSFVASHFYELPKAILDDIDVETAQLLLSSPELKIVDEDALYDFVWSHAQSDPSFMCLFEFVCFAYLTSDRVVHFVSECPLENISLGIWEKICDRLVLEVRPQKKNSRSIGIPFLCDESRPFDGIIAQLTRRSGGNVHDKGIIEVTASSVHDGLPQNLVDLETDSIFASKDQENTWVCYNFKHLGVIPMSYSIRTYGYGPGNWHLKSWVIEVSNDGNSWMEIDRRENNSDLNDNYAVHNFAISSVPGESFQFVRIRQIGKNHNGYYYVKFSALEIFGVLFDK